MKKNYQPGEKIADKYLLRVKLGEGGMGAVWRAHNETLDVDVAVKLIRAEEMDAPEGPSQAGDRLLQEARAAARLGHPAIARVFDFGVTDRDDPFIVMELLEGEDLADTLSRRGRITATKAVATLLPIAHALETAHSKGIVHRDIKPENIFMARLGDGRVQPKLVDFGVAKIEKAKNHRLTQTGAMLGSPIYMSPEQARGDDVDRLADVWALSVVLYEMVTGRPPFEGKNYNALLYSIIADEPPTTISFGTGDEELWQIIRRGLEKDPDRRWPSMQHLGAKLARWMIARNVHEDITGAAIAAQWLRRVQSGGDVLASMLPPADSEKPPTALPANPAVFPTIADGLPAVPVASGAPTLPVVRSGRRGHRKWVALAAAGVGVVAAALLIGALRKSPDRSVDDAASAAPAVAPQASTPAVPAAVASLAAPVAKPAPSAIEKPAAAPAVAVDTLPKERPSARVEKGAGRSGETKKALVPSRKARKLKNPFD